MKLDWLIGLEMLMLSWMLKCNLISLLNRVLASSNYLFIEQITDMSCPVWVARL